jgi:hypothetical protein
MIRSFFILCCRRHCPLPPPLPPPPPPPQRRNLIPNTVLYGSVFDGGRRRRQPSYGYHMELANLALHVLACCCCCCCSFLLSASSPLLLESYTLMYSVWADMEICRGHITVYTYYATYTTRCLLHGYDMAGRVRKCN